MITNLLNDINLKDHIYTSHTFKTTTLLHNEENDKWEEELQRDLQEFELVSGGDVSALDEEALDNDIMELKKSVS